MNFEKIAFLGDSFTWGEGLELYIDNPKWITQRKKVSTWMELELLQDNDSLQFRENKRFPSLVSSHFNSETIIDHRNGGSFRSLMDFIPRLMTTELDPDLIIIQFSSFTRNNIHFHQEVNNLCSCEICKIENINNTHITFDYINNIIMKKLNLSSDSNFSLSEIESEFLEIIENEFNIHYYYDDIHNLLEYLKKIEYRLSVIHLDFLLSEYLNKLKNRGKFIFFIDSWDSHSSQSIFSNKQIVDNMIPLKGYDGKYYKKYTHWEKTFPYKRIENEFTNSGNGHPTLLQHEYISNSIIEFLEKKQLKNKINYI